ALLYVLFFIFKIMPLDMASSCGGAIGRLIGPRLAASRKAKANLKFVFPDIGDEKADEITKGMWENLGRVFAEYPHLEKIGRERVEIINDHILDSLKNDGMPGILFSAHMANWEALCAAFLTRKNLPVYGIYRAPNNPWAAALVHRARSYDARVPAFPKSRSGTRALLQAMKEGHHIGILIDQKYNEGIAVPFLGKPAMTSPAFAQLCQKFLCPLVPARIERLQGARFRLTVEKPVKTFDENQKPLPVGETVAACHEYLGRWIKERPEQWLWLHRRWDSAALQSS
ncbi:MAG: lipid A biosynthesis acyltransferase, partial [Proteobacteria bacterium]|nr:lipid A biosynthesis acyltransferase [Pseudomonadota bacterium]